MTSVKSTVLVSAYIFHPAFSKLGLQCMALAYSACTVTLTADGSSEIAQYSNQFDQEQGNVGVLRFFE